MRPRIEEPFNPLEKANLATSVAHALLARPVLPLPPGKRFLGAGIYVIYYTGPFPNYGPIAERNREAQYSQPIYVGQAIPPGRRRGGFRLATPPSAALYNRLRQHARSIQQASNLQLTDFACRYLVADEIWIPLGENLLIEIFQPLWNVLIDGFGIHDPGRRRGQNRSAWDELHPGRPFGRDRPAHPRSSDELARLTQHFFASAQFRQEVTEQPLGAEDDGSVV